MIATSLRPSSPGHTDRVRGPEIGRAQAQLVLGQVGVKQSDRIQVAVGVGLPCRGGGGAAIRLARPTLVRGQPGDETSVRCQGTRSSRCPLRRYYCGEWATGPAVFRAFRDVVPAPLLLLPGVWHSAIHTRCASAVRTDTSEGHGGGAPFGRAARLDRPVRETTSSDHSVADDTMSASPLPPVPLGHGSAGIPPVRRIAFHQWLNCRQSSRQPRFRLRSKPQVNNRDLTLAVVPAVNLMSAENPIADPPRQPDSGGHGRPFSDSMGER